MKLAPIIFCGALAIFLTAVATSKRIPAEISKTMVPLNFKGIDTLEIQSDYTAKISIRDDAAPSFSFDSGYGYDYSENKAPAYSVKINGNRMLVSTAVASYRNFNLVMPSSVKNLIVFNANIITHTPVETMHVRVSRSLEWHGNAKSVRITDARDYSDAKKTCTSNIAIESGTIENLLIETPKGEVSLKALDQIKSSTLQLGANATLSIHPIHSMKAIQFKAFPEPIAMPESANHKFSTANPDGCQDG